VTKDDTDAFRFDCGSVWLNLLATTGRAFSAAPVERLATPQRLAHWLERCDLTPVHPPDDHDLRRAHELRETLRVLALATVDDRRRTPWRS
jgi:hypothetical protein